MARTPPPGEGEVALARVWDLPVRVIHWTMVALIPVSWWTAEEGLMDWHRISGLTLVGLLLFRILWGVFGSSTARFSSFLRGPATLGRYFRALVGKGESPAYSGHNPMGGWSVAAMLLLLVAQVGLGLFAVDVDGLESGPLSPYVSFDTGRAAAEAHELVFNLLLVLIALHVVAVLSYLVFRRENLISAMLHGRRRTIAGAEAFRPAPLWLSVLVAAVAGGLAWWIAKGAPNPLIAPP